MISQWFLTVRYSGELSVSMVLAHTFTGISLGCAKTIFTFFILKLLQGRFAHVCHASERNLINPYLVIPIAALWQSCPIESRGRFQVIMKASMWLFMFQQIIQITVFARDLWVFVSIWTWLIPTLGLWCSANPTWQERHTHHTYVYSGLAVHFEGFRCATLWATVYEKTKELGRDM